MSSENKTGSYKRQFVVLTAVVLSALAIGGYLFTHADRHNVPSGPPEKVTIALSAATDSVLAEVAQVQGYYLQEGLEVTAHLHSYGKPALKEVLDGKADFATVAETPVMFAIMNGEKISILATIQTAGRNNAIVARKDKGILTPSDLKGRKIAATLGTTSDFFMDAFLAVHGISRKDVKVIDLKPAELADALASGFVDAVSAFKPFLIETQKKLGERGTTFSENDIYTWTFNVVATQEFVGRNPGKVKKLLRALLKAEEFARQNPNEAQKSVADFSRMDIALVRDTWADTHFSVTLDQSLVLALEDESEWAIKNKLTDKTQIPNYLDFIYFEGLESVKPKAVGILR